MGRKRQHRLRDEANGKPPRRPLALHPLFGIVLGLWGAALGGLVTLVLPRDWVLVAAAKAGLAGIGANAPFVLAAIAALALGAVMFAIAGIFTRASNRADRRKNTPSLAAMAVRHVQTIDPANELGSRKLDDPVETIPFSGLKPGFESGTPDTAGAEAGAGAEAEPAALPPLELDLEEFGALPGRNAVWVEDQGYLGTRSERAAPPMPEPLTAPAVTDTPPAPAHAPEPVLQAVPPARPRPSGPSAIERLRAVPPSELSLVQMVERFAAALHEHQSAPTGGNLHRGDQAGREAALAEALKALAAFSPDEGAAPQGEPLRAALARLQELRGAA
jgi:hypothetical protein